MCADSATWLWATARHASQSSSSMASRNRFDPLAFVRSPMMRNEVSWWKGTNP